MCHKTGCGDILPHLCSTQHKNNTAWEAIHASDASNAMVGILSPTVQDAKIHSEVEAVNKRIFSYRCKLCPDKKPFNGLAPLESHLQGGDHVKSRGRLSLYRPNPSMNDYMFAKERSAFDHKNIPPLSQSCEKVMSPAPVYQKEYSAYEANSPKGTDISNLLSLSPNSPPMVLATKSANQAESATSIPRAGLIAYRYQDSLSPEIIDAFNSGVIIENSITDGTSSYFCNTCSVSLTGIAPLKQHLESIKHKKKVSGPRVLSHDFPSQGLLSECAQEGLESGIVVGEGGSYFCLVCNIPLTGPAPLNQHAESEKHKKKVELQFVNKMSRVHIAPIQKVLRIRCIVYQNRFLDLRFRNFISSMSRWFL
ncbi:hypothetical protein SK128_026707 [Halocaridina rubra]|uniref:C2H2-type domain-containing protein n=1 Tax=Halocaridina rubra TaxID=373956 RepID=A0AAN8X8J7_HALRR